MSSQNLDEIVTEPDVRTNVEVPRKFKVILLNDDYTPMDFVVEVLRHFFYLSEQMAAEIMLQVHHQGRGVCGIFTRDIAETKVSLVNEFAQNNQHPLLAIMEPE